MTGLAMHGAVSGSSALAMEDVVHDRPVQDSHVPAAADAVGARVPAIQPWSALVCGLPEDRTQLVVDWLLLACAEVGIVAQAVPVTAARGGVYGAFIEVAVDPELEPNLCEAPWGAVDLLVAGEHLELARAIELGYASVDITTIIASCQRSFTDVERVVAPQHVVSEREIDALAARVARAYHAFDGREVSGWYHLPRAAQPGLLLGAVHGAGVTGLPEEAFLAAIDALAPQSNLHAEAFRRGARLGRRSGGRVRRSRTAYQFTRRRRALVDHRSRRGFEDLVERAADMVHPDHVQLLQDAIFEAVMFQDAQHAAVLVEHVGQLAAAEQALVGHEVDPDRSIVADSVRALRALMVWPDASWVAARKLDRGRLQQIRAASGVARSTPFRLVEHVPLDATARAELRHPRLRRYQRIATTAAPLLQPVRVERLETTSILGVLRLRKLARARRHRHGSHARQVELDTAAAWLEAMYDCLRTDHELARITARSGTLVQGSGAVREASRTTATTFWGRVVRQSLAIDRAAGSATPQCARLVVPFVWGQLCRSGPLALWEHATPVLSIALAHARGVSYESTLRMARAMCVERRPGDVESHTLAP